MKIFLIVGLGNPGAIYEKTRHNAGFMAVNFIADNYDLLWNSKPKFNSDITIIEKSGNKIIFCKPNSFMNLSGNPVGALMSYYKIDRKNLIVLHDDIDLKFGELKCKIGGGSAGHNGLKSIDKQIGQDYLRVRIGVGRSDRPNIDVSDYVLGNFSDDELKFLEQKYRIISQNLDLLFLYNLEGFKVAIR